MLFVLLVVSVVSYVAYLEYSHQTKKFHRLDRLMVKDLAHSLLLYREEYKRFPISEASPQSSDLLFRSRGPLLQALCGQEAGGLNPQKIKFIDLPIAKNRIHGLWLNGEEWLLHDTWGEPFYIVLDTNGDGKIANPEYATDRSDKEYAKLEKHPSPTELPLGVIVYSAGKDRDPKTWHDNICSWRSL